MTTEPDPCPKFIVIKTRLVEVKGRKAWVEGRIEDTDGNVLVEAKCVSNQIICPCSDVHYILRTMFVQPKYAKLLNTKALRQAMGEPEPSVHLAKETSRPPSTIA